MSGLFEIVKIIILDRYNIMLNAFGFGKKKLITNRWYRSRHIAKVNDPYYQSLPHQNQKEPTMD